MPNFRRGAEAIAAAQEKAKSNASFTPFTPSIFWQNDGESRYIQFLNVLDEIPEVELIGFIPQAGKKADGDTFTYYEQTISRTDSALDEPRSVDPLVRDWDAQPKATNIAVAVELEPTFEERNGRQRPVGFEVKTNVFSRRIRDANGDLTDETEEVEAPVIGFVTQSPHNFFNVVSSFDAGEAPIEDTPIKVTRAGKGNSTSYLITGYQDQPVDYGGLIECIDGISYLTEDERNELIEAVEELDDDREALLTIGAFLLDKRLEELADDERYDKLAASVTETLNKWGGKGKKEDKPKRERPARRSQRRAAEAEEPEAEAPAAEPEPDEEKPKRQRRTRKPAAAKAEPETEEKPKRAARGKQGNDEAMAKLNSLRERAAAKKAAAAA